MPRDLVLVKLSIGAIAVVSLAAYYWKQRRLEHTRQQQTEWERLVNQVSQQIRRFLELDKVLATTVAEVKQLLKADRVLIYRLWDDGTGSAITETVSPDYIAILNQDFPEEVFPREYHQAYAQGKTLAVANVDEFGLAACLVEFVKQFGVKAKLVVPIIQEMRELTEPTTEVQVISAGFTKPYLWGLLIAHQCSQPRQWQTWEVALMQRLSTQVAIAIQQSELYEQLLHLNIDLEIRVQQRTQELAKSNNSLRAEISEHQRTEAALRHTNHTLQSLIAASPRAIFTVDLDNNIKVWNPAAALMFGWTEVELLDRPNPIFSEELEEYQTIKRSAIAGNTPPNLEIWRHKKDGTPIEIVFSAAPLRDSNGTINGIVGVVADITERKRLAELNSALEQERELGILKTRFFSMASHEFRTPLSTVLAAAQILENSPQTWEDVEKTSRNLRRIQTSVKNMVQLLDDILTINRAETGKLEFNPQWLDLEKFCCQFVEELRLGEGAEHTLEFQRLGKWRNTYLDEKLLRSILGNLLSNAIKYSPKNTVVQCLLKFKTNQAIIQIRDRGIGIAVEDRKQLFEPFHRGSNVRNIPGTGLGLMVVKKCIDLHSGKIAIASKLDSGTVVNVTLPYIELAGANSLDLRD
jgi:PAS domain S-box-containing protein